MTTHPASPVALRYLWKERWPKMLAASILIKMAGTPEPRSHIAKTTG